MSLSAAVVVGECGGGRSALRLFVITEANKNAPLVADEGRRGRTGGGEGVTRGYIALLVGRHLAFFLSVGRAKNQSQTNSCTWFNYLQDLSGFWSLKNTKNTEKHQEK